MNSLDRFRSQVRPSDPVECLTIRAHLAGQCLAGLAANLACYESPDDLALLAVALSDALIARLNATAQVEARPARADQTFHLTAE